MSASLPPLSLTPTEGARRRLSQWWRQLFAAGDRGRSSLLDTDALTGLPDRAGSLAQAMALQVRARQRQAPRPMALILAELDGLPQLVGLHGAAAMEQGVRELSLALRRGIRQGDLIGRWAAGAFIVVLPPTDPVHLRIIGERLRAQAAACAVRDGPSGELVPLRLHLGATPLQLDEPLGDAVRRAEAALHRAAPQGGGEHVAVAAG